MPNNDANEIFAWKCQKINADCTLNLFVLPIDGQILHGNGTTTFNIFLFLPHKNCVMKIVPKMKIVPRKEGNLLADLLSFILFPLFASAPLNSCKISVESAKLQSSASEPVNKHSKNAIHNDEQAINCNKMLQLANSPAWLVPTAHGRRNCCWEEEEAEIVKTHRWTTKSLADKFFFYFAVFAAFVLQTSG